MANTNSKKRKGVAKQKRSRGCFLTGYIMLQFIFCVIGIGALLFFLAEFGRDPRLFTRAEFNELRFVIYANVGVLFFVILCLIAVWRWRIWGFWGIMLAYLASIAIAIGSGQFGQILVNVFGMGLLWFVAKDKLDLFTWKL